jgi:hypothetical protein
MGVGLGSILKLARGGLGPDELAEILSAAGMELEFSPAKADVESFRPLAESASLPGSKMIALKGKMKGGGLLHALLVMNSEPQDAQGNHKQA